MSYSFLDARTLPGGETLEADICIIGAGAAGITIAREFVGTGVRVCLLEAGGLSIDPEVSALSTIESVGREYYANVKRLRLFGGTTNHWGGQCVPLEPIDFETRDWVDHSGWPYGYEELLPHYRRAHEVLGLGAFSYEVEPLLADLGLAVFPFDPAVVKTSVSRYNPMRFGLEYGDDIDAADNIQAVLYADTSDILLADKTGETVSKVEARSTSGNRFDVAADIFVVAAGGVENARLLLLANSQRPAGLGNHSDLVGRFFMEHIIYQSGYIVPREAGPFLDFYLNEHTHEGVRVRGHLTLPAEVTREQRIANFRSELQPINAALERAVRLRFDGVTAGDVWGLLSDPVGLGHVARCQWEAAPDAYLLANYFEQVPNPDSRVTLSEERDPLGRPQARLDWRLSRLDHDSVVQAHKLIAAEVGRAGFGRMRIEIEEEPDILLPGCNGGAHHMGTTRMDDDPARGVTDREGRVHHTNNLYVAGSSLFPTVGWANPTLTIVAMSLRLSDHLKRVLASQGRI